MDKTAEAVVIGETLRALELSEISDCWTLCTAGRTDEVTCVDTPATVDKLEMDAATAEVVEAVVKSAASEQGKSCANIFVAVATPATIWSFL